jgi:hypothetical protein
MLSSGMRASFDSLRQWHIANLELLAIPGPRPNYARPISFPSVDMASRQIAAADSTRPIRVQRSRRQRQNSNAREGKRQK